MKGTAMIQERPTIHVGPITHESETVTRLANELYAAYTKRYKEYVASCEADRAEGHRPHYCEHHTNQWVEYDNICGGCEDGVTMGDLKQRREAALTEALRRYEKMSAIISAVTTLRTLADDQQIVDYARFGQVLDRLLNVRH